MMLIASVTSSRVNVLPPTMFIKMPRAPSMEASSSGEVMAARAALTARPSPVEVPTPMMAVPALRMTVLTSAKSVLMRPGTVMMSVTPRTAESSTSSAILNASRSEVSLFATVRNRSFGITMSVSTFSRRVWMPRSAWEARRLPSKAKGRVTTPMVKMPSDRATSATTGAAPVPVPPPSPAVMKSMSASLMASSISPRCSSAAWRPISGSLPAPSPRVRLRPMSSLMSASESKSAWASVFAAMNSMLRIPEVIIRFTALTPPPPTPTTLITAW